MGIWETMEQHVGRLLMQKGNGQKKFSEGIICKIAEVLAGKQNSSKVFGNQILKALEKPGKGKAQRWTQ